MNAAAPVFLVAFVLLAFPEVVRAQSCGGDSGSGSSGSGSSGSDGGGSADDDSSYIESDYDSNYSGSDWSDAWTTGGSTSRSARSRRPHPCHGDSGIVGESRCHRFGSWDVANKPAWRLSLQGGLSYVNLASISAGGGAVHDNVRHPWHVNGVEAELGYRLSPRLSVFVHRFVYLGIMGNFGSNAVRSAAVVGASEATLDRAIVAGADLFAGTSLGLGDLRVNLEVRGGGRALILSGTSVLDDCIASFTETIPQFTLAAAVGAEYFVTPWLSMQVYGSYDVAVQELAGGLGVALHTRSYDAR